VKSAKFCLVEAKGKSYIVCNASVYGRVVLEMTHLTNRTC